MGGVLWSLATGNANGIFYLENKVAFALTQQFPRNKCYWYPVSYYEIIITFRTE